MSLLAWIEAGKYKDRIMYRSVLLASCNGEKVHTLIDCNHLQHHAYIEPFVGIYGARGILDQFSKTTLLLPTLTYDLFLLMLSGFLLGRGAPSVI